MASGGDRSAIWPGEWQQVGQAGVALVTVQNVALAPAAWRPQAQKALVLLRARPSWTASRQGNFSLHSVDIAVASGPEVQAPAGHAHPPEGPCPGAHAWLMALSPAGDALRNKGQDGGSGRRDLTAPQLMARRAGVRPQGPRATEPRTPRRPGAHWVAALLPQFLTWW